MNRAQLLQKRNNFLQLKKARETPPPHPFYQARQGKQYQLITNLIISGYGGTGDDYGNAVYEITEENGDTYKIHRKFTPSNCWGMSPACLGCINDSECRDRGVPSGKCGHGAYQGQPCPAYCPIASITLIRKNPVVQLVAENSALKSQLAALNVKLQTLEQQEKQKNQSLNNIAGNNVAMSSEIVSLKQDIHKLITLLTT